MVLGQEQPVIERTNHLHNIPEHLAQNSFSISNAYPVFGSNSTHIVAYTLHCITGFRPLTDDAEPNAVAIARQQLGPRLGEPSAEAAG